MYALNLDRSGRCLSAAPAKYAPAGAALAQSLPDGNLHEYRYENGQYIYDPLPVSAPDELESYEATTADMAAAILEGVNDV